MTEYKLPEKKIKLGDYEVYDDAKYEMLSNFLFSEKDFEKIRQGYKRRSSMDYRWYIECIDDVIYILRSWNPYIVFKIPFEKIGENYISENSHSSFKIKKENVLQAQNWQNFWVYALITQLIFGEGSILWMDALIIGGHVKIDLNSIHGFSHWRSVYNKGRSLTNDIDEKVLFYFSIFHDFFRKSDHHDPDHGKNALYALDSIRVDLKQWNRGGGDINKQINQLAFAMEYHDVSPEEWRKIDNPLKEDKTVQVCLDADKLDLSRMGVGIQTEERYLLTAEAKNFLKLGLAPRPTIEI